MKRRKKARSRTLLVLGLAAAAIAVKSVAPDVARYVRLKTM